jgi:translation initiation factor 2B subunit (eIF-2B alpha/beta/delta family)
MPPSVEDILNSIKSNKTDGAAALAVSALDALEVAAAGLPSNPRDAKAAVLGLVRRIQNIRPAMGAIGVQALLAAERAERLVSAKQPPWPDALSRAVGLEREGLKKADKKIASLTRERIGTGRRVVTCSSSATVQKVLSAIEPKSVTIGEGHPLGDGLRAASHIRALGVETKVVTDGALPGFVKDADVVLIGADQALLDGAVVNRASSFSLALAARFFGRPLIVVCQRIKISGLTREAIDLETCPELFSELPPGVEGEAPLFDITPASLIDLLITERGPLSMQEVAALGKETARLRGQFLNTA